MNQALGNAGQTVVYTQTPEVVASEQTAALRTLAEEMDGGRVDVLIVIATNPVFGAPPDLRVGQRMNKVQLRVHMGLHFDETAANCHWHIPETHFLETWSDARASDGTVSIVQPLIAPLYENRSPHELLAVLAGQADRTPLDLVRSFWQQAWEGRAAGAWGGLVRADGTQFPGFDAFWRQVVHDGFIPGTAFPAKAVTASGTVPAPTTASLPAADALEITFHPDPKVWDGRFANNGWLQELPDPVMKTAWDNAAVVSPATAGRLGLETGYFIGTLGIRQATELVMLRYKGQEIRIPVWVLPGHPDNSVAVAIGYGRTRAGRVGNGVGVDVNPMRTSDALWMGAGAEVRGTGESFPFACTQGHFAIEGRNMVRAAALATYQHEPEFARHMEHTPDDRTTLHGNWKYDSYAWGMSVDLNACVGCNACVVACQAENNIPVVGKDQVTRQREMHWIRIDRYYVGGVDNPEMYFQPMLCQHCETAPCEVVCPVAATAHSDEGLNEMVYNRCVGTRYCSNNCPYKVRRFNFLLYSDWYTSSLKMQRNPDVTVRSRGVMEKCTYCVQRINSARIDALREDRRIRDGEIVTACEAACPAQAIVFGDINDPASRVTRLKKEPRSYGVLAELNTRPRTTYLAAVRNPNPELAPAGRHEAAAEPAH
jgi:molybdopterin-containing oxidoreductase family iron-sulfur binding subunit